MQRITWAMFLLVLLPGFGLAQTGQASWDNLKQLRAGQKIVVVDMKWKSVKGTFVSVSEEAISLRVKQGEVAVPRPDVLRVSDREHSKSLRNKLLGLAIGAGAGAAVGLGAGATGSSYERAFNMGVGGLVGTGVGAGLGVLVGACFPEQQTVYRAEKQRSRPQP